MNYVEFIIGVKNRYKDKDLDDEEIVNEINCCICKYLSENNKGELLVNIYNGMLKGKSQTDIANECNVNKSLVADYLCKIRRLINGMKSAGINIKQFERFECRSYKFKEETINKRNVRRNG